MGRVNIPTRKQLDDIFKRYGVEGSRVMDKEFREIEVGRLQSHPKNELIYGKDEDVSDLIDQIQAVGEIIDALKVTEDYVIISGHRRLKAAKKLGMTTVPCEIVKFDSTEEELSALVLYNYKRDKTNEQKAREGMVLFETLSEEAVQRRLSALNQHRTVMDDSSITTEDDITSNRDDTDIPNIPIKSGTGLTRDKVAEAIGLKSGKTFDRMRDVLTKIDELRGTENAEDAELFVDVLNRSPSAARDLLGVALETLTDDDREKLKKGKVAPRFFLPKDTPKEKAKGGNPYKVVAGEIKSINRSVKIIEENIFDVENHKQEEKIYHALVDAGDKLYDVKLDMFDAHDRFINNTKSYQHSLSDLESYIKNREYDSYLEHYRDYAEEQIKNLQQFLSVIESGIQERDAKEEKENPEEQAPPAKKPRNKKISEEK